MESGKLNSELKKRILHDLKCSWKNLFLTEMLYGFISFMVLTPLLAVIWRSLVSVSGHPLLSDTDIVFFFMTPFGWLSLILISGLALAIFALKLAAQLAILADKGPIKISAWAAINFATIHAWQVLNLSTRIALRALLTIVPFAVASSFVYFYFLSDFDINYYLSEKPPEFYVAISIGALLGGLLFALLLRLVTSCFFSLPILLFEKESPSTAFQLSRERVKGKRTKVVIWILGWLVATAGISTIVTSLILFPARMLVPLTTSSLWLLTLTIGICLSLSFLVNLVVNLFAIAVLAAVFFNLYVTMGRGDQEPFERFQILDSERETSGIQLTRRRAIIYGAATMIVAALIGLMAVGSIQFEDQVQVIAHRGSSYSTPENTMAAVKQAISDGADWVEIDVQETKDGEVVVFHDQDFMKLAGVNLKIWEATMQELQEIDIGSKFAPEFKNERVPTLNDVLTECKGKVGVVIELKYYGHDIQLEQRVVEIVEKHGMQDSIKLMSLKADAVRKMKALRPKWNVGLLLSVAAGKLENIEADFLAINASFASRGFIQKAHRAAKEVCVWTINDPITASNLIGRGVDGVITDKPELIQSVLRQRTEMTLPERLSLEFAHLFGVTPEIGDQ